MKKVHIYEIISEKSVLDFYVNTIKFIYLGVLRCEYTMLTYEKATKKQAKKEIKKHLKKLK